MSPRYRRIAVIGAGPSGVAAVKALHDENTFDTIRVFERRDRIGGTWIYDPTPDIFRPDSSDNLTRSIPSRFPQFMPPRPEDTTGRTGIYSSLDSNVGAEAMAFTHTPLPETNSVLSIERHGRANPSRPYWAVADYLEDLFKDFIHLTSFNTTVERVEKIGETYTLTIRQSGHLHRGQRRDYWWQEQFDAVIVASGHFNVPYVPNVPGLDTAFKKHPTRFEHSKQFRSQNDYIDQRIVVVGGGISSADLCADLYAIVKGPLFVSQRGRREPIKSAWELPNIEVKPPIKEIESASEGLNIEFLDGTTLKQIDKIIFATGYRLSYPFLVPDPVTPENRAAGFYQHIFQMDDPSLVLIGQCNLAIGFRGYEYQAVAVARYFAGRNAKPLPSIQDQRSWEVERLSSKGATGYFHEIMPDFEEYFTFLRDFAGPPAAGTHGYELPAWDDTWAQQSFKILQLKSEYWQALRKGLDRDVKL